MPIRVLPDFLIDQIAAGEVVERPASVVKELVENALDAGADQIVIDVSDGGRTMISVIDNGFGMTRNDLAQSVLRHATSKLPGDDLLNINFMGFRGEALPSIASVSEMTIDTFNRGEEHGWSLDCDTGQIRPSPWESGTRIRVANLFARTPARLKFLRTDRAEMMSVVDIVKRMAMSRPDVGFTLNNRWRFPKNQSVFERISSVMGDDVIDNMIEINTAQDSDRQDMVLHGFVSKPTLRRASSVDQYLFVNGRHVRDKVLIGSLRASYMDVMSAREFPLCALYLDLDPRNVDVNVSPAKTDVHFLEPAHVRGFIIKNLRNAISKPIMESVVSNYEKNIPFQSSMNIGFSGVRDNSVSLHNHLFSDVKTAVNNVISPNVDTDYQKPLGRVIGQYSNKYILSESENGLIITDQHAAHERIVYEKLRNNELKTQDFLTPVVISMKPEYATAVLEIANEIKSYGVAIDSFGDDAIAVFSAPAGLSIDWKLLLNSIAEEVLVHGHSSQLQEKLHLKLANYACHHSVRAGQRLDMSQMDALLRDIERTERASQCNHGRPVYKIFKISELDTLFERS